ncbi:hypothetical protein NXX50_16900 [Bacteroides fragilis]|nr:hypothetical protein [Bacteroides fragilis]
MKQIKVEKDVNRWKLPALLTYIGLGDPTNVEEASSMIYLPYDGCWILYNCMELCALIKELFELHLLSNC